MTSFRFYALAAAIIAIGSGCSTTHAGLHVPTEYVTRNHNYWDSSKGEAIQCSGNQPIIPAAYMYPPLMAMGDSLYNGVQSGRINWVLAEWSAPVYVALRLDLIDELEADRKGSRQFVVPQYPAARPKGLNSTEFGTDIEHAPYWTDALSLDRNTANNLNYLLESYRPPNQRALVDNIAFSGANSTDLVGVSPELFRAAATTSIAAGKGRNAFTAANAAFVLNPMHVSCLEDKTPLDQVLLRHPKVLLINIGSNNGVWRAGFSGLSVDSVVKCDQPDEKIVAITGERRCDSTIRTSLGKTYVSDMNLMIAKLASDPSIEEVYINGLIHPSRAANVVPDSNSSLETDSKYADAYQLDLFPNRTSISGAQVRDTDLFVDSVNNTIKDAIKKANATLGHEKFVFVDMDAAFAGYDVKGCLGGDGKVRAGCNSSAKSYTLGPQVGLTCVTKVDNQPLRLAGANIIGRRKDEFCHGIVQGGLFSADNMHPSSIGYGLMAQTVRSAMVPHDIKLQEVVARGGVCHKGIHYTCTAILVVPGYVATDYNLRDIELIAVSGNSDRKNLNTLKALKEFMATLSGSD